MEQMNTAAAKSIRCRAAVSRVAGQPLEMEEVEVAPPRAHEVRIKILCTSICHTDITFWRMAIIRLSLAMKQSGVGAAWKVAAVEPGSSVAVFGLGAVGLAVAQGARMRGAKRIIGVDLNPDKFDVGKRLGMTDFINPNDTGGKTVSEVIKEMTGGGGADYCFECIGSTSTILLGVSGNKAPISIPSHEILRGRSVIGSLFGGIKPKNDIPMLAQKYLDKELELEEFITHEMGFEEINRAFELLTQGKSIRCIIWMDGAKVIDNGE
uniref:Alcohol dehydrogenase-like C-terminal domain-containing protein n=1 Tax=Oryza rufipogon TaxID=4529 RepID=A0A0E0QBF2_ORYRU